MAGETKSTADADGGASAPRTAKQSSLSLIKGTSVGAGVGAAAATLASSIRNSFSGGTSSGSGSGDRAGGDGGGGGGGGGTKGSNTKASGNEVEAKDGGQNTSLPSTTATAASIASALAVGGSVEVQLKNGKWHAYNAAIQKTLAKAAEGRADALALLLGHADASPDAADADGTPALAAAAVRGHADVVALLLENGAAPDAANVDGHTALMFAQNGRAQVAALRAKYLASVPAAAGAPDDANLATIDAARAAHERCVQLLLANGADARRADRDGRIAADFAPRESAAAA